MTATRTWINQVNRSMFRDDPTGTLVILAVKDGWWPKPRYVIIEVTRGPLGWDCCHSTPYLSIARWYVRRQQRPIRVKVVEKYPPPTGETP